MPSVTVSCGRCGVRHLALDPSERVAELVRFDETRGVGFLGQPERSRLTNGRPPGARRRSHAEVRRWRGSFNRTRSGWSAIGDRSHSVWLM